MILFIASRFLVFVFTFAVVAAIAVGVLTLRDAVRRWRS